jgi:hypothetical protein
VHKIQDPKIQHPRLSNDALVEQKPTQSENKKTKQEENAYLKVTLNCFQRELQFLQLLLSAVQHYSPLTAFAGVFLSRGVCTEAVEEVDVPDLRKSRHFLNLSILWLSCVSECGKWVE